MLIVDTYKHIKREVYSEEPVISDFNLLLELMVAKRVLPKKKKIKVKYAAPRRGCVCFDLTPRRRKHAYVTW